MRRTRCSPEADLALAAISQDIVELNRAEVMLGHLK